MKSSQNIYFVGPMGTGKTTIGREVARMLGMPFYDLDREVESRSGADIPWIFDVEGEAGFRLRESRVLEELTQKSGIVLATGGGAVLGKENRRLLKNRGLVVYLKSSLEQLLERTSKDPNRPLLQVPDPKSTIERLVAEREPLYQEVADIVVDARATRPSLAAREIIGMVEKHLPG